MSQNKVFIGADPGDSGAVAILNEGGGFLDLIRWDRHTTREAMDVLTREARVLGDGAFALLEKVHAMPGQGVASTFKFGQSYGKLETLLVVAGIPFDRITPAKWQKAMGCRSGGDKNVTKKRAQELFPGVKVTHRNADALLLAELCRRQHCFPRDGEVSTTPKTVVSDGVGPSTGPVDSDGDQL